MKRPFTFCTVMRVGGVSWLRLKVGGAFQIESARAESAAVEAPDAEREIEANELWDPESEDPAGVAIASGVATWHLYNGRAEQAGEMFRRILEGSGWAGFGYIAAEAEIARLGGGPPNL